MQWAGTKYALIHGTVNAGRPANGMPVWGQDYGGPLQFNDVANVTGCSQIIRLRNCVPYSRLSSRGREQRFCRYPDPAPEDYNVFLGMTMDNITLDEGQPSHLNSRSRYQATPSEQWPVRGYVWLSGMYR